MLPLHTGLIAASAREGGNMSQPVLDVQNLSVSYAVRTGVLRRIQKEVVRDVALQIAEGEIFGLIGESGCGKTTLAKAVCGLAPYTGTVSLCGRDLRSLRRLERSGAVQLVFQNADSALDPCMSVGWLLEEPLIVRKEPKQRRLRAVRETLEAVGLSEEYAGFRAAELSGGQRQRVAIGCALLAAPRLIICDEILASLDVSVQANILNLLSRLNKERGVSFLFISHDIETVCYFCSRIAVMYNGEFIETGSAEDLYAAPSHPYTRRLLGR